METTSKRCKTCNSWERIGRSFGKCTCDKFALTSTSYDVPDDGFEYYGANDESADFRTGENFGCIHWKEKLTSPQPRKSS